jgi:hypothetical protein
MFLKELKMNKTDIEKNTIFLFTRGSQAYGTNTPESDEDIGGICLPSKKVLYGIEKFEQDDVWKDEKGEKVDKVVYNLNKALDLMLECNPNMLDFLYAPERVIKLTTPIWKRFTDIRDEFLCLKAKWSFQGYAMSQLGRIKTHRNYLLNPPKNEPKRADYDLPERSIFPETQYEVIAKLSSQYVDPDKQDEFYSEVTKMFDREGALIFKKYIPIKYYPFAIADFKKRQKEFLHMISSVSGTFLKDEYNKMAENELSYISSMYNWKRYIDWKNGRNKKRAEIEAKCGIDGKFASHLIRLLGMAIEIMEGKGVLVDRTNIDRDILIEIRNGLWTFEQVVELSDKLNAQADNLYKSCTLPNNPNYDLINKIRLEILEEHATSLRCPE